MAFVECLSGQAQAVGDTALKIALVHRDAAGRHLRRSRADHPSSRSLQAGLGMYCSTERIGHCAHQIASNDLQIPTL